MPSKSKKRALRKKRQHDSMYGEVAGWITPDLENHPVGEVGAHYDWVIDHFKLPRNSETDSVYRMAFVHGYVRYRSSGGFFDVEGKKENVAKTESVWKPLAKNRHEYVTFVDAPGDSYLQKMKSYLRKESLEEGREYLGNAGEYGGWITKDKKVYPVDPYAHHTWVSDNYGVDPETGHVESYDIAYEDGAVRYLLGKNGLELNGYVDGIKALFNVWWPTAIKVDTVLIEPEPNQNEEPWHALYHMPEHKSELLKKWRPGHPTRDLMKKIQSESVLTELRKYLGNDEEYGGWIDKHKKVHTVEVQAHYQWVQQTYDTASYIYAPAWQDGAIRYTTKYSNGEVSVLSLQGPFNSIARLLSIWWPTAIDVDTVYIDLVGEEGRETFTRETLFAMPEDKQKLRQMFKKPKKVAESIQLNELREYLGLDGEYGGWITKDKKVHIVEDYAHTDWVIVNYDTRDYMKAFDDGAIRYQIENNVLDLEGTKESLIKLFRIWWPSALNVNAVAIDVAESGKQRWDSVNRRYQIPNDKTELLSTFGPGAKQRDVESKVKEATFGAERRDKTLKGKLGYTVSIFKHEVCSEGHDEQIRWSETVGKVRDVKSGLHYQDAIKLGRTIEEKFACGEHEHGWVDYFTQIQEDDVTEAYGGTVGFMFRGGYDAGMRSTAKNTKKRKPMSPFSKINEKYNTNSTWLKVGKNIVEVILNKATRRIKRGDKITEVEIPTYKIFVDGVDVGYVDNIDGMFFVKNDKSFDRYDNLEEAISKVMGSSYYDGKGSTEFVQNNPDPIH